MGKAIRFKGPRCGGLCKCGPSHVPSRICGDWKSHVWCQVGRGQLREVSYGGAPTACSQGGKGMAYPEWVLQRKGKCRLQQHKSRAFWHCHPPGDDEHWIPGCGSAGPGNCPGQCPYRRQQPHLHCICLRLNCSATGGTGCGCRYQLRRQRQPGRGPWGSVRRPAIGHPDYCSPDCRTCRCVSCWNKCEKPIAISIAIITITIPGDYLYRCITITITQWPADAEWHDGFPPPIS
mmetsp:Transcript_116769/g.203117  ORF Transcript_116769/g.203117 Transcript_116769/m.203117 type:complete len:234 (-) Transcript_116769:240-941(-)